MNAELKNLIKDEKLFVAPRKTERQGIHYEFIIAIGKDESARITMTKEAYDCLMKDSDEKN